MIGVMNIIGLKFVTKEAKKLASAAIGISKRVLKTCLKIQFNVAVFPLYFVYGGLKYVYQSNFISEKEIPSVEPSSDEIVNSTRKLQNSVLCLMKKCSSPKRPDKNVEALKKDAVKSKHDERKCGRELLDTPNLTLQEYLVSKISDPRTALMGVSDFSGRDYLWDVPILAAKGNNFAQCLKEKNESEIMAAKKALEEHPVNNQIPSTRQEYNSMKYKAAASQGKEHELNYAESSNGNDCKSTNPGAVYANAIEVYTQKNDFSIESNLHSPGNRSKNFSKSLSAPQYRMCREISETNRTLRKIQATCSRLLGELSNLNEVLSKIISMKEHLTSLEFQVEEGKKLLHEVECDRFIMKSKLAALEKLINEEERYLCGEASCESGFYENID